MSDTTLVTQEETYSLGSVERGTVSDDQYIGTTNELDIAYTLTSLQLSGIHKAQFDVYPDPHRSIPCILEPGDSYAFIVNFTPSPTVAPGQKTASVTLTSNLGVVVDAQLSGIATASGLAPQLYDIITEDDVFSSGFVDEQGNYVDTYDIWHNKVVDADHGVVPAGSSTAHDPPRLRADGNIDLRAFRQLMRQILSLVSPDLIFVPAYPSHIVGNTSYDSYSDTEYTQDNPIDEFQDTITWKVVRREVGVFTGTPFSESTNRKEIKPRIRERAKFDPSKNNRLIDTYGQWYDNLVQFDVWAKTNEEAEVLIEWFEDFMDLYKFLFMKYGLENLIYWRRFEDQNIQRWANPLHVRSVQYYCRTEKLTIVPTYKIEQIHIKLMETVDTVGEANQYGSGEMQRNLFS